MRTAVCHTEGCTNADQPINLETDYLDPDTGETMTVGGVYCGVCQQQITDVTPPLDQAIVLDEQQAGR